MFRIMVETETGDRFQAFTWTRDAASGIQRALDEAPEFDHKIKMAWAEETEQ